jgi:hypothetical protein
LPGHRRFADAVPEGARFHYAIAGVTHPGEWETGEGELNGDLLVRGPLASSADGAAVDFSAGLKTVALTVGAAWFAGQEEGGAIGLEDVAGLEAALEAKADLSGCDFSGGISAQSLTLGNDLGITDGGTGASSAGAARNNLGLGSLALQAADAVAISGGSVSGIAGLGVAGDCDVGGFYRVDAVKVVGNRVTGWGAPSGTASRAAFDTSTVTLSQLAQRLKALIDDLRGHGLIGS